MNITEIAPKKQGLNSLDKLSELVTQQGFCIGQEIFFKAWKHKERVVVVGYTFELNKGILELSYSVEDVKSVHRWLNGQLEEPSRLIATKDQLCINCDLPERE